MTLYQRKRLSTGEDLGEPGPLPADLVGLDDAALAQLGDMISVESAALYADIGFVRVADPPEPPSRWIHKAVFIQRIPAEARIAIRAAAEADPLISDFLFVLEQAELVYLDLPALQQGVGYLQQMQLLSAEQAQALLA